MLDDKTHVELFDLKIVILFVIFCIGTSGCALLRKEKPYEIHVLPIRHIPQKNRILCGPTVLAMVLNYWGDSTSPEDISKEIMEKGKPGASIERMKNYCRDKGYYVFAFFGGSLDIIKHVEKGRPVIIMQKSFPNYYHLGVAIGYIPESEYIIYDDPLSGLKKIKYKKFDSKQKKVGGFLMIVLPKSLYTSQEG